MPENKSTTSEGSRMRLEMAPRDQRVVEMVKVIEFHDEVESPQLELVLEIIADSTEGCRMSITGYTEAELARASQGKTESEKRANPCIYLPTSSLDQLDRLISVLSSLRHRASQETSGGEFRLLAEVAEVMAVRATEQAAEKNKAAEVAKNKPGIPGTSNAATTQTPAAAGAK